MVIPTLSFVPIDSAARRAWIVFMLRLRGTSLRQLSLADNKHSNSYAVALWKPYPNGEKVIASALQMDPAQIWPERYDSDGAPIKKQRGRPRKKSNALAAPVQSKSAANG